MGRLLGQGAMSEVFEAVDELTGRAVAVKVVRSGDPDLARRMAQEARALELVELDRPGSDGDPGYWIPTNSWSVLLAA
jgi:serine/threonine protein kinase